MKRSAASTQRTGQPTCAQRLEIAMNFVSRSEGSVSIAGLNLRMYTVVLPASPIPGVSVMTTAV